MRRLIQIFAIQNMGVVGDMYSGLLLRYRMICRARKGILMTTLSIIDWIAKWFRGL